MTERGFGWASLAGLAVLPLLIAALATRWLELLSDREFTALMPVWIGSTALAALLLGAILSASARRFVVGQVRYRLNLSGIEVRAFLLEHRLELALVIHNVATYAVQYRMTDAGFGPQVKSDGPLRWITNGDILAPGQSKLFWLPPGSLDELADNTIFETDVRYALSYGLPSRRPIHLSSRTMRVRCVVSSMASDVSWRDQETFEGSLRSARRRGLPTRPLELDPSGR